MRGESERAQGHVRLATGRSGQQMVFVLNWLEDLKERMGAN